MSFDVHSPLSRRIVLTGLMAGATVPALAGCGIHLDEPAAAPRHAPDADERARRAVVAALRDAQVTLDEVDAARSKSGSGKSGSATSGSGKSGRELTATLDQVRAVLNGQLAALGASVHQSTPPGTNPGGSGTGNSTARGAGDDPASTTTSSATVRALVKSVDAVQRSALRRLNRVSGVFARRLAGIAAGSAAAAHALGSVKAVRVPTIDGPRQEPTGKPSSPMPVSTPSSGAATALLELGRGLYAAIYGYEVLTVRLSGSARTFAARRLGDLRTTATDVGTQLRDGGAEPAHPKPGYSLPYPIHDAATAAKFAAAIERRLEMRIGAAVTAVPAGTRADAAAWLTRSTLARLRFSTALPIVPGSKLPKRLSPVAPSSPATSSPATSSPATSSPATSSPATTTAPNKPSSNKSSAKKPAGTKSGKKSTAGNGP